MGLEKISPIVSALAAVIAIVVSVCIYWHGLKREIRLETIKALSEIRKKYFNTKNMDNEQKLRYLNELEYFSVGVNQKIYDFKIVRKMSGHRLNKQYHSWMESFIQERRTKFDHGHSSAYQELERMMKKIDKSCK